LRTTFFIRSCVRTRSFKESCEWC